MSSELFEFNFNGKIILHSKCHWNSISYNTEYVSYNTEY